MSDVHDALCDCDCRCLPLQGKKVVLVGFPGGPVCVEQHIPGYISLVRLGCVYANCFISDLTECVGPDGSALEPAFY